MPTSPCGRVLGKRLPLSSKEYSTGDNRTVKGVVLLCAVSVTLRSKVVGLVAPHSAVRSAVTRPVASMRRLEMVTPVTVALAPLLTETPSVSSA